jgi:hypothetical protein
MILIIKSFDVVSNTWPSRCGELPRRIEKEEPALSGSECLVDRMKIFTCYEITISLHAKETNKKNAFQRSVISTYIAFLWICT